MNYSELMSEATIRNWERLSVKPDVERLMRGANKTLSSKKIIPVEYIKNKDNIKIIDLILDYSIKYNLPYEQIIYSLGLNYLYKNKLIGFKGNEILSKNIYIIDILKTFFNCKYDDYLLQCNLPDDETDFLGIIYQTLLSEGNKNIKGSYYTPSQVTSLLCSEIGPKDLFLDPCCGSGSFLMEVANKITSPENIYGCDIDEIACFIAKINLILKYKDKVFKPNIYCLDFIDSEDAFKGLKFDIIATNPPWGAKLLKKYTAKYPEIKSKESFSYFILKSKNSLQINGSALFVLPESILNVACHKDIRKFILQNFSVDSIRILSNIFSGVLSNVVILKLLNRKNDDKITIFEKNKNYQVSQKSYEKNKDYRFALMSDFDVQLLNKIFSKKYLTLERSSFALGIVTGNNKKYLFDSSSENLELIYTGKNVSKYFFTGSAKYIEYNRKNFQQAAKDEIYRAKEKLVYKFVSKNPIFVYDNTLALVLNSANIVIPNIKSHSIKTVLAYLNSNLFYYIYVKKFSGLKILKNYLNQLPFPVLSGKNRSFLELLVNNYLKTKDNKFLAEIDKFVYKSFDLSEKEIEYIEDFVYNIG